MERGNYNYFVIEGHTNIHIFAKQPPKALGYRSDFLRLKGIACADNEHTISVRPNKKASYLQRHYASRAIKMEGR
jgi:hypothetical protein